MKIGVHNIAELVAVLVALYCYPQLRKSAYMKWFLPFLVFVFLGELYESYLVSLVKSTIPINYLIGTIECLFYGYVFFKIVHNRFSRLLILVLVSLCVIGYIYCYFAYNASIDYFVYNLVISGFVLSLISLVYLYQQFNIDEGNMLADPGFWLAFGICLFFSSISIVFITWDTIRVYRLAMFGMPLYQLVPKLLCILLYGSLCMVMIQFTRKNLALEIVSHE
jgi:hypothetical protein